jgi:Putative neutral zinc metallopeptidase
VRRGLSTRILLLVAASLAAVALISPARGGSPQAVASWVAPRLNAYWDAVLTKQGLVYENPRYYYWYNRRGYGWIHAPLQCDMYRKRDGLIWGGSSPEYAPNSFYCAANDDFYFDWAFWRTLPRGAAVVVAAHEWGHHVQHLLGWPERERVRRRLYANYELMADCYAGAFVRHERDVGELASADVTEGRRLLERLADVERVPWSRMQSHGTPADRRRWFARGFDSGDPQGCAKLFGR